MNGKTKTKKIDSPIVLIEEEDAPIIMYAFDMQKLDCQWHYNSSTCDCKIDSNSTYNVKESGT